MEKGPGACELWLDGHLDESKARQAEMGSVCKGIEVEADN